MIGVQVQQYLGRARDFLEGMNLLKNDLDEYRYSSALLGIHCAISYCDALRTGIGTTQLSSEDHRNAEKDLRLLLAARKFKNIQGAGRLGKLLSKKNWIAYAPDGVNEDDIKLIHQHAERFASWAEAAGRELKIEGW